MLPTKLKPEELAQLGRVVVMAAELENTLEGVIQGMGDWGADLYKQILHGKSGVQSRLHLFKQLALTKVKTKKGIKMINDLVELLLQFTEDRNIVVHGLWSPGGTGGTLAQLMLFDPLSELHQAPVLAVSKAAQKRRIPAKELESIADAIESLNGMLRSFYDHYYRAPVRRRRLARKSKKQKELLAKYA